MSDHPPAFRLDALAAGDQDAAVIEHLKVCAPCAAYVSTAKAAASAFRERGDDFLAKLQRPEPVVPIGRRFRRATLIGGGLLVAAATLLVVRGSHAPHDDRVAGRDEPATRFKGSIQLAAIRDRAGTQTRLTTEVRVKAGDRLRVEVGVDDARPLEVGFLGRDGTWVLLMAPTNLEAGTSFSERSARFDDTPTEGWIIAAHPDEIERAKSTHVLDGVRSMAVRIEP